MPSTTDFEDNFRLVVRNEAISSGDARSFVNSAPVTVKYLPSIKKLFIETVAKGYSNDWAVIAQPVVGEKENKAGKTAVISVEETRKWHQDAIIRSDFCNVQRGTALIQPSGVKQNLSNFLRNNAGLMSIVCNGTLNQTFTIVINVENPHGSASDKISVVLKKPFEQFYFCVRGLPVGVTIGEIARSLEHATALAKNTLLRRYGRSAKGNLPKFHPNDKCDTGIRLQGEDPKPGT